MNRLPLSNLALSINSPLVSPNAPNYRPPCWPPKPDWPIVIDSNKKVISRWGDPIWRLDPWAGYPVTLNFGDGILRGNVSPIDHKNANLLRIIMSWWLYGPNGSTGHRGFKVKFSAIRPLFSLCSQKNILASELSNYPSIIALLPEIIKSSRSGEFLLLMHELYEHKDFLGFTLLDRKCLIQLAYLLPNHEKAQTPYIPPRILHYQISRLKECLQDFLTHCLGIEACFKFWLEVYQLKETYKVKSKKYFNLPSGKQVPWNKKTFTQYFAETSHFFGINELLEKWGGKTDNYLGLRQFSSYLTNISRVGIGYILNFSLMRFDEAWSLRSNCLVVEDDPRFGKFYLLKGKTSKTIKDKDTFWVTSPSVVIAVEAMNIISKLRNECVKHETNDSTTHRTPHLINYETEPWSPGGARINKTLRPGSYNYRYLFKDFPKLFNLNQFLITQQDFDLAMMITPSLSNEYAIGKIWPIAWHQLRRSGAVNMQASGLVSIGSLQFQLKHATRAMSLYYGQNYSKVNLNKDAQKYYIQTMYEILGKELQKLASDRFLSPYGDYRKAEIVKFITTSDVDKTITLAKKGTIVGRPILLGFCANREPCPYGGIDNIAHCGGGYSIDSKKNKPCVNVLYDQEQLNTVDNLEQVLDKRLTTAPQNSPLKASLEAQKRSIASYRNVIFKSKSD